MNKEYLKYDYAFTKSIPEEISGNIEFITRHKGQVLWKQGDTSSVVYFLCEGRLRLLDELKEGNENCLVWISPGEMLGDVECLAKLRHNAFTAEVFENDTKLMQISRTDFHYWLEKDHRFCLQVAESIAKKLNAGTKIFSVRLTLDSDVMVYKFIVELIEKQIEQGKRGRLNYTRAEIARNCGISERTVNRTVTKMKNDGLIDIARGKISMNTAQYIQLKEKVNVFFES